LGEEELGELRKRQATLESVAEAVMINTRSLAMGILSMEAEWYVG